MRTGLRGQYQKGGRGRLASHLAVRILQRHLVECAHRRARPELGHRRHTHLHEIVAQRTAQRLGSSQLA